MYKLTWLAFTLTIGLSTAQAQKATWNLSNDLRASGSQISFSQGSNGVWYFMESAARLHDPTIYRFLPDYLAPCFTPYEKAVNGLACWRDKSHASDWNPIVLLNFTDQTQNQGYPFGIPPHAVIVHPTPDRWVIVAWKSPLNGVVRITGRFTDLDSACGNGVLWFIDERAQKLRAGTLPNGGAADFNLPAVSVTPGQVLHFIVAPNNGDYYCDTTMLDLTIDEL